jgi:glyoxylase-like metal-dependent hydrolase (beta-lactamase superfamily II)
MDSDFQIIDVAPDLWIWRMPHPDWSPPDGGDRVVTSTVAASGGEIAVLDPLAPPDEAAEIWDRLNRQPPTMAVVVKPDHVRSIDAFVERFGCRAYGPELYYLDDQPNAAIEAMWPGSALPGGLMPLYDGRSRNEWPIWLPKQRTIVFADALTALGGELQVWDSPWHEQAVLPALRAFLDLPFERVIISHGSPIHSRAEFERALARPPFAGNF